MGNIDYNAEVPFQKDNLVKLVERLLIASSPWQDWALSMRQIYRWEDPKRTSKWLIIWFFVWWANYTVCFVLGWIAFITLENRYKSRGVENLRHSYDRALNSNIHGFRFNELINRHGSSGWMDPLLDAAGPQIQLQLTDLADFMEILANWYDWRYPEMTWATLFWFACAITVGVLNTADNSNKIVWMFCLISFFLGRPIASHSPKYRHCVNALKWIFWDIPTDAEWAMMYLRNKAQETRARLISKKVEDKYFDLVDHPSQEPYAGTVDLPTGAPTAPVYGPEGSDSDGASWHTAESSTNLLSGLDLLHFRCRQKGIQGHLIIYSDGLRFVRASPFAAQRKELWRHPWSHLREMRKANYGRLSKLMTAEGLELLFTDDTAAKLEGVEGRDRAFNCIVGFSGLSFQVLAPVYDTGLDDSSLTDGERMSLQGPKRARGSNE